MELPQAADWLWTVARRPKHWKIRGQGGSERKFFLIGYFLSLNKPCVQTLPVKETLNAFTQQVFSKHAL